MPPIFEDMQVIKLGQSDADNIVTVVTNPLCGPCAKLHEELNQLLAEQSNIRCQFIFIGPSRAMQLASQFLNTSQQQLATVMDSWYHNNRQDVDQWIKENNFDLPSPDTAKQLNMYSRWCELASITATPTIFINGVQLQSAFQVKDIKRIVPMLKVIKMQAT